MATVTKISVQKRNKKRVNVYLDGVYAFSLCQDLLLKHGLHEKKVLAKNEISKIKEDSESSKINSKSLSFLSRRPYGEEELRDKLVEKGFDPLLAKENIKNLKKLGLIDDLKFARAVTRDQSLRKKGKRAIYFYLKRKGIAEETIDRALKDYEAGEEKENALHLARKKRKNLKDPRETNKLFRFLNGRGFSAEIIKEVIAEIKKDPF